MESMTLKGANATISYDGEQISIKHNGFGTVSTYVHQVVSVDLKEPGRLSAGVLEIATLSSTHKGWMPTHPWRVRFPKSKEEEFKRLYTELMERRQNGKS